MNSNNNNNENHEIAVCQHLYGRFAHSSVLCQLTYLLLLRYYISGKTMFIEVKVVVVLLRYKQGLDYIENVVAHHAIIDPRPTKEACV